MSSLFQLSIYTAGTRRYAEGVAKIIDPTSKLFNGRIVSRSDIATSNSNDKAVSLGLEKSLQRIFLGDASMAIILDDREDVWRGAQSHQLMLVRPFVHFRGGHEVNNSSGYTSSNDHLIPILECQTLTNIPAPAVEEGTEGGSASSTAAGGVFMPNSHLDDQLLRCEVVLRQIHASFYDGHAMVTSGDHDGEKESSNATLLPPAPPSEAITTANLLADMKTTVLHGCVLTFR